MIAARLDPARRRALVALAALAGLLALVGCARIPVEGPVQQGAEVVSAEDQDTLYYPGSPVAGATEADIVTGFLEAGTGTADNYKVAREFLTPASSVAWDATARTVVVESAPKAETKGDGLVHVTMDVVAEVDAHGRYREHADPQPAAIDFTLEQVDGQWRIADAPEGIVLLKQNFVNIFAPFPVSFLDASETFIVPEIRWFPSHATAPTRIVQALLAGPTGWLAEGGVKTVFPAGTQLLGPIIPDEASAEANFSSAISSADPEAYPLMKLQLVESLSSFPAIDAVTMLVNGAKIDVEVPAPDSVVVHSQVNVLPLVVRDGQIGYLSGDAVSPIPGADGLQAVLPGLEASAGAVSDRVGIGTFLTPHGVVAVPYGGGATVPIDDRPKLLAPTIGPWGFVWTLPEGGTTLRVSDPIYGYGTDLELPNMGQTAVRALSLSRSGTTLSLAIERNGKAAIATMAVTRDATTGRPIGLGEPQILEVDAQRAIDLSLVDSTTVALLASDASGQTEVFIHQLGGTTERYGGVEGGAHIEGSNTRAGLRVSDGDGSVYVPRSTQWQASGARVDFLVAQS